MGKIRGIFQFTGKLGEAVGMKGDDGQNYARVRVREVANPNTEAQQDVRTIASLAGKISSITPADIIQGMRGNNKRQRRSAFTKNIMLNATTLKDITGKIQAVLEPEKLVLSQGQSTALPELLPSISQGIVNVVHSAWPEDLAALVIVAYGATEEEHYVECKHVVVLPSDQSPAALPMGKGVVAATVYAIPVTRADGASNTSYESALEALENDREFAVTSTGKNASSLGYQKSEYLGGVK